AGGTKPTILFRASGQGPEKERYLELSPQGGGKILAAVFRQAQRGEGPASRRLVKPDGQSRPWFGVKYAGFEGRRISKQQERLKRGRKSMKSIGIWKIRKGFVLAMALCLAAS